MLKRIINNEFIRTTGTPPESKDILESDERINNIMQKLKSIDSEMFKNLDNEIGSSISMYSRYYFTKGFDSGLQLANEIKDMKVK